MRPLTPNIGNLETLRESEGTASGCEILGKPRNPETILEAAPGPIFVTRIGPEENHAPDVEAKGHRKNTTPKPIAEMQNG